MNITYDKEDLDKITSSVKACIGSASEIMDNYDIPYEDLAYNAEEAVESYVEMYSDIKDAVMEHLSESLLNLMADVKEQVIKEIAEELLEYTGADTYVEESSSNNKNHLHEKVLSSGAWKKNNTLHKFSKGIQK